MNDFRDRILGRKPFRDPLLRSKDPARAGGSTAAEDESFADLSIPRAEGRLANHRDLDRHRLSDEAIELVHGARSQWVRLVNLSGGGAMIEDADGLRLWDRVELRFDEWNRVEAAVRWVRGGRLGLEFAHETRVEADAADIGEILLQVIQRSFPDVTAAPPPPLAEAGDEAAGTGAPDSASSPDRDDEAREMRHPLIWLGEVHYDHSTQPVRLRNISSGGALIECANPVPTGAELLLDLGEAGTIFATVHWTRGDAAGLRFHSSYDVKRLAAARPAVAGQRWIAPDYLRETGDDNSPWARQWGRSDLAAIHRRLGGTRPAG